MNTDSTQVHYAINGWLLDSTTDSLIHQKTREIKRLGEFQFRLLMILSESPDTIFSRDRLNALVWEKRVIGQNSLPNAIHALRAALEDCGKNQKVIKTVPRKGYLLDKAYCIALTPETESSEPAVDGDITVVASPQLDSVELSNKPEETVNQPESDYLHNISLLQTDWVAPETIQKAASRKNRYYVSLLTLVFSALLLGAFLLPPPQAFSGIDTLKEEQECLRPDLRFNHSDVSPSSLAKILHLLKEA
ncbi:DNA-binding transcriptional activator CadC [Leminorella richardii]|uniref:DNA-binding transcriptional activator CadC n=1 Tax=Leminorella richardii TaxID=158841 RepID=A0A2X4Y1C7_9GAMM|nr:winged helix-turn-helix domain-containing protein [Leminorella richardii]SQI42544.1 DNA-binding transcriptional activator CadC [Leminorella richardii]